MNESRSPELRRRNHVYEPSQRLLREEVFWAMLDRERALADRGGRAFALAVFDARASRAGENLSRAVEAAVLSRIRRSDAAGWLDNRRIGALLTGAGGEAARHIAEAICDTVAQQVSRPDCRIYVYPMPGEGRDFILDRGVEPRPAAPEGRVTMSHPRAVHELIAPPVPAGKRLFDIALSGLALAALSPLFIALALYVRFVSPGPVFFRHTRVGRACRTFECLKFRTMHVAADTTVHANHVASLMANDVPMTKLESTRDPRLIPGARLIRASGLDELPQLLNVLRGDMSLVGPRPPVPYEFEKFAPWHRRRCDTLPGLTGLWQVNGKNRTTFTQMMRYDVRYSAHPSLATDAQILIRTIPAVVDEVRAALRTRRPT